MTDWLTGQSFTNVLLALILLGIAVALHYAMTEAIPGHLQKIQQGYEKIHDSHQQERKEIREQYDSWMSRILDRRVSMSD